MIRRAGAAVLAALLIGGAAGCATYSERIDGARAAVAAGDYESAVAIVNRVLEVESHETLPEVWGSESALAVLERASLLQALGDYRNSARDYSAAETELEYLDLSRDNAGKIGKYVYSDASEVYHVVPTEHLAINGGNMVNYLAMGDLAGARVEARRFTVVSNYLAEAAPDRSHAPFLSYLAGFVFEKLGNAEEAMRYYDEALQGRTFESLRGPIARLASRTRYRGKKIDEFLAEKPAPAAGEPPAKTGELLVIVGLGRVPYKVPKRMPIGVAIGLYASLITWDTKVLERSATKFLVYPELVPSGSRARGAAVKVDGKPVPGELASRVGEAIKNEYEVLKPKIIISALTRMAARAAAYEGARHVGKAAGGGILGIIAGLAVEGLLVGLDKPDTRSWNFLPNTLVVSRLTVPAGRRRIQVFVDTGVMEEHAVTVNVPAGGFAVVPVFDLR